jgi:hypothetical protein
MPQKLKKIIKELEERQQRVEASTSDSVFVQFTKRSPSNGIADAGIEERNYEADEKTPLVAPVVKRNSSTVIDASQAEELHRRFEKEVDVQITKVQGFYDSKLNEFEEQYKQLCSEIAPTKDGEVKEKTEEQGHASQVSIGFPDSSPSKGESGSDSSTPCNSKNWSAHRSKSMFYGQQKRDRADSEHMELIEQELRFKAQADQIGNFISKSDNHHKTESIKRALVEMYRLCYQLDNYTILNYTAIVKILKKFDKKSGLKISKETRSRINAQDFVKAAQLKQLAHTIELLFAAAFTSKDIMVARHELMMKREESHFDWSHVIFGIRVGAMLILCMWYISSIHRCIYHPSVVNTIHLLYLPPIYCIYLSSVVPTTHLLYLPSIYYIDHPSVVSIIHPLYLPSTYFIYHPPVVSAIPLLYLSSIRCKYM